MKCLLSAVYFVELMSPSESNQNNMPGPSGASASVPLGKQTPSNTSGSGPSSSASDQPSNV